MSTELPIEQPKKKSCLERAVIFFIRLIFAFVVGIAIGVGIYFGIRLLYDEYQSLTQDYDARITTLETNQSQYSQLTTDRMSGLQTRLENLEIQGDTQKNTIADLENRLDSHDEFRSYQATVVAGQQETIQNMQEIILAMQTEVNIVQTDLDALENSLSGFQEDIIALETKAKALANTVEENQTANQAAIEAMNEMTLDTEARLSALEHKMAFLVAMELLTRARLNLVQGNYTLAQSDIEAARDLLVALQEELLPFQSAYVDGIITAIYDLLKYLPSAPLTAADKLESVWQMLAAGLPDETDSTVDSSEESTPVPIPTLTPTPKP